MPYINFDEDVLVHPDDFFNECSSDEREELKELVYDYFHINHLLNSRTLTDAVIDKVGADDLEAKDFIKRTIEEMEYKLKMRDFS